MACKPSFANVVSGAAPASATSIIEGQPVQLKSKAAAHERDATVTQVPEQKNKNNVATGIAADDVVKITNAARQSK